MMPREDSSSVGPPNIMVPRQSGETLRPLRPSERYSIDEDSGGGGTNRFIVAEAGAAGQEVPYDDSMKNADKDRIGAWLVERGLAGASETELLHGFCARCNEAGLDFSRAVAIIDTLHPTFEGR